MSREVLWGMSNKIYTSHPKISTITHFDGSKMCLAPPKPTFPKFSGKCGNKLSQQLNKLEKINVHTCGNDVEMKWNFIKELK